MNPYPPRAEKKYSQTWEFNFNRIGREIVGMAPRFLKMDLKPLSLAPIYGAFLSLVPGLGTFYLTQKIGWPLIQFVTCGLLCLSLPFSLGSAWGTFLAMFLFSLHQFLMYRCYLKGLELNRIPPPGFWGGMRVSLFMTVGLAFFYYLISMPFSDRFFCARANLGTLIAEGDRFIVSAPHQYLPGEVIVFNQAYQYRDGYRREQTGMVERILAREGDQVSFKDGKIWVNGKILAPEAGPLEVITQYPQKDFEVPGNSVFVLFPMRTNMPLNPDWFLVNKGSIQGKLAFQYSPHWEVLP